ncbi:MAG: hypothetical protein GY778_05040, partial [bacterium]|nr:hypothetical protein [bacterium]
VGVYGESVDGTGIVGSGFSFGVVGEATAATGPTAGARFDCASDEGMGLQALANSATGSTYGLWAQSLSDGGVGLYGYASSPSGNTFGVVGGTDSPDGYAGYFLGRGYFSGNVGIGVLGPQARLHIGGTPGVDGIMFPDGSLQTTASGSNAWSLTGNSGTDPSTNFIGTTDDVPMEVRVNGLRALRIEPGSDFVPSPNLIGGFSGNAVTAGVVGATIGGGGDSAVTNVVTDDFGTVGGGQDNQAGDDAGTTFDADFATVGGGVGNTASGT